MGNDTEMTSLTEAVAEIQKDLTTRNTWTFLGWIKVMGSLLAVGGVMFAFIGQIYTLPKKIDSHEISIKATGAKLEVHDKNIVELQNRALAQREMIDQVRETVKEVAGQQKVSIQQQSEINKNIIELTSNMKYYNDGMKEIKEDLKAIRDKRQP